MNPDDNQIQQGQEIYASPPAPSAEEELTGYDYPPEPPPPSSPMENILGGLKRFLIPFILLLVAIVIIIFFVRLLKGGGTVTEREAKLTYWILWEDESVFEPLVKAYEEKHPKTKITLVKQTPKEYRERLENAIVKGEGPDLFRFHNTWLPMLLQKNVVAPVPEKVITAKDFDSTFYPVAATDLKNGNAIYGMPLTFDALGLYYNKSILKAAGASPPTTWAALQTLANDLTVRDTNGRIRTAGVALGTTNNVEFWPDILGLMILQNSASITNPKGANAEDALLFYTRFAQKPDNVWDKSFENSIVEFAGEKVAMMLAPSWVALELKARNPKLDFAVAPVPQLPGVNVAWATYWVEGVSSKSKYQDEAFAFLAFLVAKDNLTNLFSQEAKAHPPFGEPYSRSDLASSLKGDPYLDSIVSEGPYAKSGYLSSRTFDNGLNDRIIKYYEDAVNSVNQGANPNEALSTATKGINQVLTDFGMPTQ